MMTIWRILAQRLTSTSVTHGWTESQQRSELCSAGRERSYSICETKSACPCAVLLSTKPFISVYTRQASIHASLYSEAIRLLGQDIHRNSNTHHMWCKHPCLDSCLSPENVQALLHNQLIYVCPDTLVGVVQLLNQSPWVLAHMGQQILPAGDVVMVGPISDAA